ncbi:hypothetical protein [Actinoplanes flavus]|uniref:Uncharacterized protein n=1 Tax=Actinoplanes flavus TaxID=2820290 RepID=A0ABS3UNR1_9ACTN|nr:hypothetical protein [Actinoplanes flavus]MBO3740404.1 hypothetical protein [Actinoplanes flavus]
MPLTHRYRAELFGHDPDPVPPPRGHHTVFAVAVLLSVALVGLATVVLH